VPISAPGQNSRNEKNIRSSIIDRTKVILGKQEKQKSGKENRGAIKCLNRGQTLNFDELLANFTYLSSIGVVSED
jgi:hypothetical protein